MEKNERINHVIYNKAIRDHIPDIIRRMGKTPFLRKIEDKEEYRKLLNAKLQEELDEYIESEKLEELADLVEVIYGILELGGITREEFEHVRLRKREERGGFEKQLFLEKVEG